jgi:hypothetical protein
LAESRGIVRGCAAHPSLIARDRRRQGAPTSFAAAARRLVEPPFFMFSGSNPIATTPAGSRFMRGSGSKNWRREGFEPDSDPGSDQQVTDSENISVPGDPHKALRRLELHDRAD